MSQLCNSAQQKSAEEEENSLRERYREKSAEVRKLQSKIMVSWAKFCIFILRILTSLPPFFTRGLVHV